MDLRPNSDALLAYINTVLDQNKTTMPPNASQTSSGANAIAASSTIASVNSPETCPLFRLSGELRNMIYAYAFTQNDSDSDGVSDSDDTAGKPVDLYLVKRVAPSYNLLLSCRLIHTEAKALFAQAQRNFWRENDFSIELRTDWSNAPVIPDGGAISLYEGQVDLMQKLVVVVKAPKASERFVFIAGSFGWHLASVPGGNESRAHNPMFLTVLVEMLELMSLSFKLRRDFKRAAKYFVPALKHFNVSTVDGDGVTVESQRILVPIAERLSTIATELEKMESLAKRTQLNAILQHCFETWKAKRFGSSGQDKLQFLASSTDSS